MTNNKSTNCTDCNAPLGWRIIHPLDKNHHPCDNHHHHNDDNNQKCNANLCTVCYNRHPLLVPKKEEDKKDSKEQHPHGIPYQDCIVKQYCKTCFQEQSTIDFSSSYHQVGDVNKSSTNVTYIMVHGGSSNQQMFHYHALELEQKYGYASILLDLPGHGTMVDETPPLTLDSCVQQFDKVLTECGLITKNDNDGTYTKTNADHKIVYVGGSLGAYIGFHLLDAFQSVLDGAVMMDCGQNVGPGASFKAKAGLVLLKWMGSHMSNAKLMPLMIAETKKSKHTTYHIVETVFGAGMFFDQGAAQVECLKTVAPAQYIPKLLNMPILFMNGSKDYRDSENKWLELCKHKDSELKVYDDGDHFFMHDTRFVQDVLTRMHDFVKKL